MADTETTTFKREKKIYNIVFECSSRTSRTNTRFSIRSILLSTRTSQSIYYGKSSRLVEKKNI